MTENKRGSVAAVVLTCVNYEIHTNVNRNVMLLDDKLLPNCLIELSYLEFIV